MIYEKFYLKTTRPLSGKYMFRDKFQVYPIDKDYIVDNKIKDYYLCALEIKVNKKADFRYSMPYQVGELAREAIEVMHLLSVTTKYFFYDLSGPEENSLDEFSEQEISEIDFDEIQYYMNLKIDVLAVETVCFPKEMNGLIENYYSLSEKTRNSYRKAIFLFYTAVEIETIRTSFAYLSLIAAIESIISISFKTKSKKCEKCGQEIYSISKRFKWFISKFSGITDNAYLNKLYSFRSKIVHAGDLFLSDLLWSEFYDIKGNKFDDYFARKDMILITRACLLNWNNYVISRNNEYYLDNEFINSV